MADKWLCGPKKRKKITTLALAERYARNKTVQEKKLHVAYVCRACGLWHVTNNEYAKGA